MKSSPDLFDYALKNEIALSAPLAARMRPTTLEQFVGQEEVVGPNSILQRAIKGDHVGSMILWGPPGTGKTTLAKIIATAARAKFFLLSAVASGVTELRKVVKEARELRSMYRMPSILFIDEIHRFNKAQQDAVLPFVENGLLTLIGATTENPSFEVNKALLSRCRVYLLKPLTDADITTILNRALQDLEKGLGRYRPIVEADAFEYLVKRASGDARIALNSLEYAVISAPPDEDGTRTVTLLLMQDAMQYKSMLYDKDGEMHYDLISALHKSMRNSDPDASLYWLARMIEGGEDPLYIMRRVIRFASEDVGLADPNALTQAINAYQAVHFIGLPEANVNMAQAVVYMALAPKSNSMELSMNLLKKELASGEQYQTPKHLRNAPTALMKELGYGKGYKYAHDYEGHIVPDMQCLPDELVGRKFYTPSEFGWEAKAYKRLKELKGDTE